MKIVFLNDGFPDKILTEPEYDEELSVTHLNKTEV